MSEAPAPTPTPTPSAVEAPEAPAATAVEAGAVENPPEGASPLSGSPLGEKPPQEGEAVAPSEGEEGQKVEGNPDAPPPLTLESYEFKLPEGVAVDETTLATFKQSLVDSKVAPEVAQTFMDMHLAELNKTAEAFAAAQNSQWTETITAWKTAIDADPELGGDNKSKVTASIARALDTYGTPETRAAFDLTGSGWNPAIIKFIHKMASALDEGSPHSAPGPASSRSRNPADILYPPKET